MAQYVVLDSVQEDIFVCGYCKVVLTSLAAFLNHKKSQCNQDIPSSEQTSESTTTSDPTPCNNLQVNVQNDIRCRLCTKTFKKMKSLLVHLRTHNGKPYQCMVCGRCFSQNSHLKRHELSHKVWPGSLTETTPKTLDADTTSYTCMYCRVICSNYSQFRVHLKNHIALKKFKCVQRSCNGLFNNMEQLLQHVSLEHKEPVYGCPSCHLVFNTLEDTAAHQQSHHTLSREEQNAKSYKCSQCDASFKKKENLTLHMANENHNKTCIHCSKTFVSDKRLRLHLQIHRKCKPFQCEVCQKTFSMKKYLTTHMLRHSERQFVCPVCNFTFKRKDLLQRHAKIHQKKKMFKCPFRQSLGCNKEFSRSDKLNLHIKNHTKHMPVANNSEKQKNDNDPSTIEIFIVPLNSE